ncbi:hypothetical protein SNE40_012958 [Patella caerulea]|uniref:C1q domain-containing protein n=1 Tax=Patella caerulea TaxID=87958 RepID=A0AAN8PG89_PATCE
MQMKVILVCFVIGVCSADKFPVPTRYNTWVAGTNNCSCSNQIDTLNKDLQKEVAARNELKGTMETYVSELHALQAIVNSIQNGTKDVKRVSSTPLQAKITPEVSFSAKLSYNRELQPLDTVVFDTIVTNNGDGYSSETGKFTTPVTGTYFLFSTILSGYNTKVETAIIVNDKEVGRMYSGAHDAHGSGSNGVIVNLQAGDSIWIRLLYQGGTHVHGFYTTFSGFLVNERST